MSATVNLSEAKERLAELVAHIAHDGGEVLIVDKGHTLAKLVAVTAQQIEQINESSSAIQAADALTPTPGERAERWQSWVESRSASSAAPLR